MDKSQVSETAQRLLNQPVTFSGSPVLRDPRYISVVQTKTPTQLEAVITSMIIEATLNGNVNAAKLLMGYYVYESTAV